MAENSAISWTDHTFNPWIGCTKVSPACDGCYAEALMGGKGRFSRAEWGAPGRGEGTRTRTKDWSKPRKWNRQAADAPGATFVFCASLADVFDNAVPAQWRADLFDLIRATPNLTWLLLTKRPTNIVRLYAHATHGGGFEEMTAEQQAEHLRHYWPRNAAIGCTVISQDEARRDIPVLLRAGLALKPAFTFVSMEPLLGPVDLTNLDSMVFRGCERVDALNGLGKDWLGQVVHGALPRLGWVIAGGETDQGGHLARPTDPAWFRSLRDQCADADVPFHFKQWGEWQPYVRQVSPATNAEVHRFKRKLGDAPIWRFGKAHDPCTLDGVRHDARPAA